jgi:N-acetylglucosamine-6-phosphate deacetylase
MPSFHHRNPGILGLLGSTSVAQRPYYGIICDGVHVHPNSVRIGYHAHRQGAILVTDAMSAMGLNNGSYTLGSNMNVTKTDQGVHLKGTTTLAGSSATMPECIRNLVAFTNCSLAEALTCATQHPADLLGIAHKKGTFSYGADADIVLLDDDLNVRRVFVGGDEVDTERFQNRGL